MRSNLYYLVFVVFLILGCNRRQGEKDGTSGQSGGAISMCSPAATSDTAWFLSGKKAPILAGLKGVDFPITTSNAEAQQYFNQGLMLSYGFNHAEAARSFFEAIRLDSNCAMAHWGFAYVLGPNYNGGMEEGNFLKAWKSAEKAKKLSTNATALEIALIGALGERYAADPPADRTTLDAAYAAAMKGVFAKYSGNPDVGALYAESLMNLHPWDLYDKDTKEPHAWTPPLIDVLERLLKKNPAHPGAHHLYIHAMEASATPEKALASAGLLDTLVRGSGHLLHMPSHIYINTGDYHLGTLANVRAVAADSNYTTACHAQGVYPLSYFPHNYHFLAATATLEGNSKLAWQAALKVREHTAEDLMRIQGWGTLQHYFTIPYYVAVKLAMWDRVRAFPKPARDLVYPRAIWHYARGMEALSRRNVVAAQQELDSLTELSGDTVLQHLTVWDINTTADLVKIASKVLSAGILAGKNQPDRAAAMLTDAVRLEDNLNYNEPPDWFFSVRHHLGAVLIKAGRNQDAERVYRDDLRIWKKNGWALIGLYHALQGQKKIEEAESIKKAFDESWKFADNPISSSSTIVN